MEGKNNDLFLLNDLLESDGYQYFIKNKVKQKSYGEVSHSMIVEVGGFASPYFYKLSHD